jgi:hypothetical protein
MSTPLGSVPKSNPQLVVDDDGVGVPLVTLLRDVVAGERLVRAVGLGPTVVAVRVGDLGPVAAEAEDDVVALLGRLDERGERGHDVGTLVA